MCEYALKEDGKMLMCAYTGKPCTLCVLGSGETFAEAEHRVDIGEAWQLVRDFTRNVEGRIVSGKDI